MSDFICHRCGRCCGFVPFTAKEYRAIKREAKELHISFVKATLNDQLVFYPKSLLRKMESINPQMPDDKLKATVESLVCPFLERNAVGVCSCKIYDKRPEVCRLFGQSDHPYLTCPYTKAKK